MLTVPSSTQGRIADAAPQSTPHTSTSALTRWFTRHLAGAFLKAAVDARRSYHTAQAVALDQAEHAAQRPRREEFLEAYSGLMRAYDPPFLMVATAADEQLIVVLLRDVPVLSSFIAQMPYLQVEAVSRFQSTAHIHMPADSVACCVGGREACCCCSLALAHSDSQRNGGASVGPDGPPAAGWRKPRVDGPAAHTRHT